MNRNQIIGGILIGLFSLSVGFDISQIGIVTEVREHTVEIRQMKQSSTEERSRTDARIFQVAELIRAVIDADKERQKTLQEFIQILRVQNELLQRNRP